MNLLQHTGQYQCSDESRFDHFGEQNVLGLMDRKTMSQTRVCQKMYFVRLDFVRLKADLVRLQSSQMVRDKLPEQLLRVGDCYCPRVQNGRICGQINDSLNNSENTLNPVMPLLDIFSKPLQMY